MNARISLGLAAALGAVLSAGCGKIDPITQPAPQSGSADFSRYVATGTSITAGWESGGLVDHHQRQSYAYLFARQAGALSFTIPSVSADGFPPLLQLHSLSPLVLDTLGRTRGTFTNYGQATAYNNMAVPYSLLFDLANETNYYNQFEERNNQFNEIVRHRGTILQDVLSLQPTFLSIEYGSNEVLGAATAGIGTPLVSAQNFDLILSGTLAAIQGASPQTKLALFTVPDVTSIPFVTTFRWFTVDAATFSQPMPLIGPNGPLGPDDHVLLTAAGLIAAGNGIPVGGYNYVNPLQPGNGNPLPNQVVLDAAEAANLQITVDAYNASIRAKAAAAGAAVVDLNGLLKQANATGLRFQGTTYTPAYIKGGLFSLDGVHPTDLAHGFIANLMIDAVNAHFGAHIPEVNLSASATATASRLAPAARDGKFYPVIEGVEKLCPLPLAPMPVTASLVRASRSRNEAQAHASVR
jgi:lysophospholipase L1-like esterase